MTRKAIVTMMAILFIAGASFAQSEAQLASALEGQYVVAKMDLPATKDGVDVYVGNHPAVNMRDYAQRLKRYGTAVQSGDRIMVTKLKVKKDLIEVQLGGGGFGTLGDNTNSSIPVQTAAKSQRERDLERDLKDTDDPRRQRRMREELDALRQDREREDARLRASVSVAEEMRRQSIRAQALQGGSRFNLHYEHGVPLEVLTTEAVMGALAEYVDFSPVAQEQSPMPQSNTPLSNAVTDASADKLRKGQQRSEVENLLGDPEKTSEHMEGTLRVNVCSYVQQDSVIEAMFVEGILVRYTIASR
jgi:hypothetical protein